MSRLVDWLHKVGREAVQLARVWLLPGPGIKRWVVVLLMGVVSLGMGIAFMLVEVYQGGWLPLPWQVLTLQWLPRPVRAVLLGGLGVGVALWAIKKLNEELFRPLASERRNVFAVASARKRQQRGPRVVAIGGGTGMSMLLRGLKQHTSNITAVITVADDGGSSGRLRRQFGILPPGDFRNCLVALADDEALLSHLFQYRFAGSEDIGGHSFGNLFIAAMAAVSGSFEKGVEEASKVLAVQGAVLPSTLADLRLVADVLVGAVAERVVGESAIPERGRRIQRVYLEPDAPPAYPGAVKAILAADVIVVGPGSLYTSILPNLLVPDIAAAIQASRAKKVFVCNVASEPGETDGYAVSDYLEVVELHTGVHLFDAVLANDRQGFELPGRVRWVPIPSAGPGVVLADVVDEARPWRHEPQKLAAAIMTWRGAES